MVVSSKEGVWGMQKGWDVPGWDAVYYSTYGDWFRPPLEGNTGSDTSGE